MFGSWPDQGQLAQTGCQVYAARTHTESQPESSSKQAFLTVYAFIRKTASSFCSLAHG